MQDIDFPFPPLSSLPLPPLVHPPPPRQGGWGTVTGQLHQGHIAQDHGCEAGDGRGSGREMVLPLKIVKWPVTVEVVWLTSARGTWGQATPLGASCTLPGTLKRGSPQKSGWHHQRPKPAPKHAKQPSSAIPSADGGHVQQLKTPWDRKGDL